MIAWFSLASEPRSFFPPTITAIEHLNQIIWKGCSGRGDQILHTKIKKAEFPIITQNIKMMTT